MAFRLRTNNSPTNDDTVDRQPQNPLVTASIQIVSDNGSSGSWKATNNVINRMLPNRLAISVPTGMLHLPLNSLPRYHLLNAPKGAKTATSHNLLSIKKQSGMVHIPHAMLGGAGGASAFSFWSVRPFSVTGSVS